MKTQGEGLKVLIIEDSPDCASLLKLMLDGIRFFGPVTIVGSGEEGRKFLEDDETKTVPAEVLPDLIFLDLGLPGEGGLETLDKIKRNPKLSSIPVIIITASDDKGDWINSYKKGSASLVRKPFNRELLTELLQHMVMTGSFRKKNG